jgi:hypothetical protein
MLESLEGETNEGKAMMRRFGMMLMTAVGLALVAAPVVPAEKGCDCDNPYGAYKPSPRWGWYGAPRSIATAKEAREYLEDFYASSLIRIGTIIERNGYFEAEIYRKANAKRDRVIIDKRCGRIRSIE